MKAKTSDTLTRRREPGIILIPLPLRAAICEASSIWWESLFQEFRLELQGRIVGSGKKRDLLKLHAKLEYINELEQFFKSLPSVK